MSNFKSLMAEAASMSMDELDARQKEIQSEADFLADILKMRKKLGDRTSEQLRRKARREEKSLEKKNMVKRRTAVDVEASVNTTKTAPAKSQVSSVSDGMPPIGDLFGN